MKTKSLLSVIAIVFGLMAAVAQKPFVIRGGELCEGYLLKKIAREQAKGSRMVKLKAKEPLPVGMGRGAENSPIVRLSVFKTHNRALSASLEKWLKNEDVENLAAFRLDHKEKQALILGSTNIGATGIASNFQNWHIRLANHSIEFLSLSENPRLIFWDRRGQLNYYAIDYGDEFLKDRNWDNLTLDLRLFRISSDGEARLVSEEQDVRCK
jgi:hypothetical protein